MYQYIHLLYLISQYIYIVEKRNIVMLVFFQYCAALAVVSAELLFYLLYK